MAATATHIGTYNNGKPYFPARGRSAPREQVETYHTTVHPVIRGFPTTGEFLRKIVREMKIRFYQPKTIKQYRNALAGFLRWFGAKPHRVTSEDVRDYLELLVDGGGGSSVVGTTLSAIRTAFDKMCGRQVTLGLATPRRPKRLPSVPSQKEVRLLLEAAPSLRDKLLIGLMYATGVRVSEVVRLRWRDIDFDRRTVSIWQGKGRVDRQVMLPESFESLLKQLSEQFQGEDYLFPAESVRNRHRKQNASRRHLSPRTVERVVERAVQVAGIKKHLTPHSMRHGFASHLLESGTDIRFIQKLLGHAKLETTTIYTKVAVLRDGKIKSPIDALAKPASLAGNSSQVERPVGSLKCDLQMRPLESTDIPTADVTLAIRHKLGDVSLGQVVLREVRKGWISMELPSMESWEPALRQISPDQRERLRSAEFYQRLNQHLTRLFLVQRQQQ